MLVLLLIAVVALAGLVAGWRHAVGAWRVETPRQAVEAAWYRLNPPRAVSVGALQQRIMRAAVGARLVSVRGVALVPSTFEVALHPDDLESIAGVREWIASELATALEERAEKESWLLSGRPVVAFLADERRVPGRPEVRARHESRTVALGPRGSGTSARPHGEAPVGWLRPLGDEDPVALTGSHPVVLGRGAAATIDLGDPSVSRRHCELHLDAGTWVVDDLGSANGTTVNGRRIDKATALHPGDELGLGGGAVRFVAQALDPVTRVGPERDPVDPTEALTDR
ncbi:MAG: FhaA domain-containing protein [Acidimicrobiales bacterium]